MDNTKTGPKHKLQSAQLGNMLCLLLSYLRAHDQVLQQIDIDAGVTVLLFHQCAFAALRQTCHTNKHGTVHLTG